MYPVPVSLPDLTDHLGYWLRLVSNHVSQGFARKLAEREVTVGEWVVMRVLYDAPPTAPSAVAARMGMTRGAITRLADRLIAKGLLRREASAEDGRAQTLRLTPQGAAMVPDLAALADGNDAECFGRLAPAQRAALESVLRQTAARLGLTAPPID